MPTAQEMVDLYIAAEQTVLKGQTVRLGDRMVSLPDLRWIVEQRAAWEKRAADESRRQTAAGRSPAVAAWSDE